MKGEPKPVLNISKYLTHVLRHHGFMSLMSWHSTEVYLLGLCPCHDNETENVTKAYKDPTCGQVHYSAVRSNSHLGIIGARSALMVVSFYQQTTAQSRKLRSHGASLCHVVKHGTSNIDTIDHSILLQRLQHEIKITGTALD